MNITVTEDFGARIELTPKEVGQLILDKNLPNTGALRFRSLGEKLLSAVEEKRVLPVFILAGTLQQASNYARRKKIRQYIYIDRPYRLKGHKKIELHYVGTALFRLDLEEIYNNLRGIEIKSYYE